MSYYGNVEYPKGEKGLFLVAQSIGVTDAPASASIRG